MQYGDPVDVTVAGRMVGTGRIVAVAHDRVKVIVRLPPQMMTSHLRHPLPISNPLARGIGRLTCHIRHLGISFPKIDLFPQVFLALAPVGQASWRDPRVNRLSQSATR